MKNYKLTFIGVVLGFALLVSAFLFELDLFESLVQYVRGLESYEIDELIIPALVICVFAFADLVKKRNSQQIELEKLKVYEAMMNSTHHVLNNFLNQAQLLKIAAEETPGFDRDILIWYEKAQQEASEQIDAMGSISDIDEVTIHSSVAPK